MPTLTRMLGLLLLAGVFLNAAPVTFFAQLGDFENPPTGSTGTGSAWVTMDLAAHTLGIEIVFSGLIGTTMASHIHCCAAAPANAGVATQTPTFLGFPLGVMSGTYSNVFNSSLDSTYRAGFVTVEGGGSAAGAEKALFNGLSSGLGYLNIHTTRNTGGEIRGFLVATPEPASIFLAGGALLSLALFKRRGAKV